MLTGQIGLRQHGNTVISRLIEWATRSHTHHCVIAVSETECVSAEPGGVRLRPISHYPSLVWSRFNLTDVQRGDIILHARNLKDTPYNYAAYPWLLAARFGIRTPAVVAAWLERRPNLDCSQLVDVTYTAAGIDLFPQHAALTTPGDLERYYQHKGWLSADLVKDHS